MFARLLLAAALLAAAPAAAQTRPADPFVAMGDWIGKFAALSVEPASAAAACGPQLNSVMGARDATAARAAAVRLRPCTDRIRAAYRRSAEALAQFAPMPAELQAAVRFDSGQLIEGQRRQFTAAIDYMDQLDLLLAKVAANDRAGAAQLLPKVRAGAGALIDGTILPLRAYQAAARFGFTRYGLELRIIAAEAAKLALTGPMSQTGLRIGEGLNALVPRTRQAVAGVRSSWEQDKTSLRALGGSATMDPLLDGATPMVGNIALAGEQMASSLAQAARRPVVAPAEVMALLSALNRNEIMIANSIQKFAQTLQTIGK